MTTAADFATAAQALAASVLAAISDPADQVRALTGLNAFTVTPPSSAAPIGAAMASMQAGAADLFRRAAVGALARASAAYQPSSYDDAVAVRDAVCGLLDAEATIAADQGQDQTYMALRQLRAAVSDDLTRRGAGLAPVATFTLGASLPAVVLAQRLYQDPTRATELLMQANPPHPAFMPTTFRALAR